MTGGETAVKQVYGSRQENFRGRPGGGPTVFTSNSQTIRAIRHGLNAPPGAAQAAAAASSARAAAALRVLPARDGGWQRPQTKP